MIVGLHERALPGTSPQAAGALIDTLASERRPPSGRPVAGRRCGSTIGWRSLLQRRPRAGSATPSATSIPAARTCFRLARGSSTAHRWFEVTTVEGETVLRHVLWPPARDAGLAAGRSRSAGCATRGDRGRAPRAPEEPRSQAARGSRVGSAAGCGSRGRQRRVCADRLLGVEQPLLERLGAAVVDEPDQLQVAVLVAGRDLVGALGPPERGRAVDREQLRAEREDLVGALAGLLPEDADRGGAALRRLVEGRGCRSPRR